MKNDLTPHLDIALRHAPPGLTITRIPRVDICVGQGNTDKAPCLYRSMVCFILQGSKHVAINDNRLSYDSEQYLISALDLPLIGQIVDAEDGRPYVAVSLVLDPAILAELASTMPFVREREQNGIGIMINPMTASLRDTLLRLLALLDTPDDIPVLGPMLERELLYRLLQGPQGQLQLPTSHRSVMRFKWHESSKPASPFPVANRPQPYPVSETAKIAGGSPAFACWRASSG